MHTFPDVAMRLMLRVRFSLTDLFAEQILASIDQVQCNIEYRVSNLRMIGMEVAVVRSCVDSSGDRFHKSSNFVFLVPRQNNCYNDAIR